MTRVLPQERLNPKAVIVWRIRGMISSLLFAILVFTYLVIASFVTFLPIPPKWGFVLLLFIVFAYGVYRVLIIPALCFKYWRYEATEEEIDLYRGIFVRTRTVIPMVRVQHVDTEEGPLFRHYHLATVTISTAATQHEIPALANDVADALREKISRYAMVVEEDV